VPVARGRPLLGPSGRARAGAALAGCAIVAGSLGLLFAGQTRPDGFDNAVDSRVAAFFGGHEGLLSWLALPGTLIPAVLITAVISAGCLITGRRNGAVLAMTAVPAAAGLNDGLLKHLVHRTSSGALAFPSGHTASVVAMTATLAVLLFAPPRRASTRVARVLVMAVFCVLAVLVVLAVTALRWHYFTDTIAGAAVGAGTVCALALILDLAWPGKAQLASVRAPVDRAVSMIQARTRASSRQAS
jgi:membrane-associated phospholipid phosphatase